MSGFDRIVVASDLGPASRRALDTAVDLAKRFGSKLFVVHVVERFTPPYPIALMPEPSTFEGAARIALDEEVRRVTEEWPSVEGHVLIGDPSHEVTTFADAQAADLVVIGTHGRRGPSRWLLGSVAERIVRASRAPVLTIRGDGVP